MPAICAWRREGLPTDAAAPTEQSPLPRCGRPGQSQSTEMLIEETPNRSFSDLDAIGIGRGPGKEVLDGAFVRMSCPGP